MTSTKAPKANAKPRAKSRMRSEIVEAMRGLHAVGAISEGRWKRYACSAAAYHEPRDGGANARRRGATFPGAA
jgi:hypothetical protein